jgi:RNA recognition motif-containing protein
MANNIYVGGFPYKTTKDDLTKLFSTCGTVVHAKVILDRETGRPKGFGFVEMSTDAEAKAAVAKLNGAMLGGRKIFAVEGRADKSKRATPPYGGGVPLPHAVRKGPDPKPGEPGFVERRSGKDRRAQAGAAPGGDRRDAAPAPAPNPAPAKTWVKKPWVKKEWPKKPGEDRRPPAKTVPPLRGKKWFPPKKS